MHKPQSRLMFSTLVPSGEDTPVESVPKIKTLATIDYRRQSYDRGESPEVSEERSPIQTRFNAVSIKTIIGLAREESQSPIKPVIKYNQSIMGKFVRNDYRFDVEKTTQLL